MLISAQLQKDDIVILKVAMGDEVIAKLVEISQSEYIILKPLHLGLMQNPQTGQPTVGMAPWAFGIDDSEKLAVSKAQCIFIAKARREARDQYIKNTTNITVAGPTDLNNLPKSPLSL